MPTEVDRQQDERPDRQVGELQPGVDAEHLDLAAEGDHRPGGEGRGAGDQRGDREQHPVDHATA